jgi:hypothetical protein
MVALSIAAAAPAAEVVATLADGKLGARVDAIAFPPTLPKELTSGLTNRLYARVSVDDAQAVTLARAVVEIAIRYDLWDQTFIVSGTPGAIEARTLASIVEVRSLLGALRLPRLFDADALPDTAALTVRVELLLNPIEREKARMIRKWVAENSTPEVAGDQGISMSNALFNRIFEQFTDGSDVAAGWRVAVSSAPFRMLDLRRESDVGHP